MREATHQLRPAGGGGEDGAGGPGTVTGLRAAPGRAAAVCPEAPAVASSPQ